ncbi:holin [Actinophytocola sp. KF-1]
MWKAAFWKDAVERAIRTFAQTFGALVVAAGTGLLDTAWLTAFSAAGMAGLLSVLTSLASEVKAPNGTASMIDPAPAPELAPAVEPGATG